MPEPVYRCSEIDVRGVIDVNRKIKIRPFIGQANRFLNNLMAKCTALAAVDDETLANLEILLAAHYAQLVDPQYTARSTGGASGSFQGQYAKYLERTAHGQSAIEQDPSGCLQKWQASMVAQGSREAGLTWLGSTESESTDYDDRN